ncbi:bromodomain-containing protein DDB_G0280777-like isoform X2 [Macrobrachium nipponense]|uniref:bromodomain-containing protein DDB_G0280777-like isoform X2 n=1 Tax=Macrobrachium nipponense TaxID=159736 RepID=UPI0030C82F43
MSAKASTSEKAADMPDDVLTNLTRSQFNEQLDQHQTLLQAKNAELTRLTEMLKSVREQKEPFTKIKVTLQTEINEANIAINAKTEEVTLIKQKLRYHSVKQINENIERLEYQLRNNNFKPREEQKILDEISMLQRSTKTLKEYEAKQAENKKYRAERSRLIDERNSNYSKIKALHAQEDEIKKAMTELRGVISSSRKSIDHLRQMKPALEKKWVSQLHQQQAARNKRFEDKKRQRHEHFKPRDRQEPRRKIWEKYDAYREPYEEECDMCRVLITYLQSSMNALTLSTPSSARLTPSTPAGTPSTPASDPDYEGSFYMKPKDDDGFIRVSKRERAKAKKEHRLAKRVKELPHTPDVLLKFTKLSISPPKNTDEIPCVVIKLQDALQHYHQLYVDAKKNNGKEKCKESKTNESENVKCMRPTSLAITPPQLLITTTSTTTPGASSTTSLLSEPISTPLNKERSSQNNNPSFPLQLDPVPAPHDKNKCLTTTLPSTPLDQNRRLDDPCVSHMSLGSPCLQQANPLPNATVTSQPLSWAAVATKKLANPESSTSVLCEMPSPVQTVSHQEVLCNGNPTPETLCEPQQFGIPNLSNQREETKLCNGILPLNSNNESFFSARMSYSSNLVEMNNNTARSYANVTAKINVAAVEY